MSNLDKLVAAGMAVSKTLKDEDKALVEKLTPEEVAALISAHEKIGGQNIKRLWSSGNEIF
jgi:hypothetical protein